jgi:hypothetical protein
MRRKLIMLGLCALALAAYASAGSATPATTHSPTPAVQPAQPAPAAVTATATPVPLPAFLAAGPSTTSVTPCCTQAEKLACYHYHLIWTCDFGFCSCTAP